jgi:hypothetical protein
MAISITDKDNPNSQRYIFLPSLHQRENVMPTLKTLLQNWTFSQHGGGPANQDNEWLPAAKVPTSVHAELLRLGKIPDPFVGMNEWEVQCKGCFPCTNERANSMNS